LAIATIGENVMECERPYRYLNGELTRHESRNALVLAVGPEGRDRLVDWRMQGRNSRTARDEMVRSSAPLGR
jgi:hypothetical protein